MGRGNVAMNLHSLGSQVFLLAATGRDDDDDKLYGLLPKRKFLFQWLKKTLRKTRILANHQQLLRLDYNEPTFFSITPEDYNMFWDITHKEIAESLVVVLSDYGKGFLTPDICMSIIKHANSCGVPVLVDPKGTDYTKYAGAFLIKPNQKEFAAIQKPESSEMLFQLAEYFLVTKGSNGMCLMGQQYETQHFKSKAKQVYDVTGAGDTVIATLAWALSNGKTIEEACHIANDAAGIVVGKLGTATVRAYELETATDLEKVEGLRDEGKQLVLTNGCFDILHHGHISLLTQAKAMGDVLVVAINSDESVRLLKGDTRPINDLTARINLLKSLKLVDFVFSFSNEDELRELVMRFKPKFLVKGSDYRPEDVVGYNECVANGGKVVTVPLINGVSTTKILEKGNV